MSLSRSPSKQLKVVALLEAAKDKFMGLLMYQISLDLRVMKRLENGNRTQHQDIVQFMRNSNIEPTFHTPQHYCTFTEDMKHADAVICLINVTESKPFGILELSYMEDVMATEVKIIVLVGGMDDVDWNPQPYSDPVAELEKRFKKHGVDRRRLRSVPIASAGGDNFLDLSSKSPWYSGKAVDLGQTELPLTVVEAIDS